MLGRLPVTARIAIALIVIPLGVFSTWHWWHYSRNWEPVNAAPSFSSSHEMSVAFEINIEGDYSVVVETLRNQCPADTVPCDVGPGGVKLKWVLTREGKKVGEGKLEGNQYGRRWGSLGGLHETTAHYVLSLELPDNASLLGFRESSVQVFENGGKQQRSSNLGDFGLLACFLCVPVGICLVLQSVILRRQERSGEFLRSRIFDAIGSIGLKRSGVPRAPFVSRRNEARLVGPWSLMRASTHGLILTISSSMLWSILCVAQALDHQVSMGGLRIRVARPGVVTLRSPGLQPVLVRIAAEGLFVDSLPVSRRDLDAVLRRELDRRPPNWPVYFKGDSRNDFGYSSDVIDAIRGQGAEVIVLTRKSWSEF